MYQLADYLPRFSAAVVVVVNVVVVLDEYSIKRQGTSNHSSAHLHRETNAV
jgi:hypothetical protein